MSEMIRRIHTEAEYEQALDEIERFFNKEPAPGTPEAECFGELARAVEAYESEHWAIEAQPAGPLPSPLARRKL